jgi:outer membrane protein assembly factor BamB
MIIRYIIKFTVAFLAFLALTIIVPTLIIPSTHREHNSDEPSVGAATIPVETLGDATAHESDNIGNIGNTDNAAGLSNPPDPDQLEETTVQQDPTDTDEPDEPDEPEPLPWLLPFQPYAVESTRPERMLASTAIMVDGRITEIFSPLELIDFGIGDTYSELEGITTFRGNNFRDSASYGFADIQYAKFGDRWSRTTGSLTAPDGATWTGHGWTGQPLIVKWPKQTREIMNMHAWAKEADELVEVVYPAMDGYIYFSELETGNATRNRLFIGYTFKGTGALDPRGYPLLYVGAGYPSTRGSARIFVISLIDGSVLHSFGNGDSFAPRNWSAADAAPLIDGQTDTLIYPSENGLLYLVRLNSVFDPYDGRISVRPSAPVKWRFVGNRSNSGGMYWLGIESSPVIWRGHLILADNGGHLICLDLNTLEPVWVQDVLDDTNNSPVLELENGHPYIYISTGFHGGWRAPANASAPVPIWKIDAVTGEIVWKTEYYCYTQSGVSGGVQGTIAVGRHSLNELIFVPVARTPSRNSGILAALDKNTGEVVWEFRTPQYGWSSPVCVYDENGKGYVIFCSSGGVMYLLDGLTGELLDSTQLGGVVEASPAVYENTVVIGTRSMRIIGIKLT